MIQKTRIIVSISFLITTLFSSALFAVSASSASKNTTKKHQISRPKGLTPAPAPTPTLPSPTEVNDSDPGVSFGLTYSPRYTIQSEEQVSTDATTGVVTKSRDEYFTHELISSLSTKNYRLRAIMDFYDHFKAPQGNSWDPVTFDFTINNPWALTEYFFMKPEASLSVPLLKTESQSTNLNSTVGARMHFILNSKNTIPDLIFKYNIQYVKNNLKEDRKLDATKLDGYSYFVDTRLRHRVFLGYMMTEKLMAMVFFQFDSNFLHDNTVTNKFYHETFLEYTFNDVMSVDVGLANGGGIYTGEYQDVDNLKFYNKESSEYFVQMNFSL